MGHLKGVAGTLCRVWGMDKEHCSAQALPVRGIPQSRPNALQGRAGDKDFDLLLCPSGDSG